MDAKLYVGNLPYETTEEELQDLFMQAGRVASVAIIKDRDTGRSRGFAFVEMNSRAEAQKAVQMFNGYALSNRALKVNPAQPREEGGPSGGYRQGFNRNRNRRSSSGGGRRY